MDKMQKMKQSINEKIKSHKEQIGTFALILMICFITCAPLLQMHMSSDTYNFMDLGYFEYPKQFFLKDARVISAGVSFLAGILNLSYPTFIVGMEILAIGITSISIYLLYKTIIDIAEIKSKKVKIMIVMASFIIILNCMSLEYLLYAENAVMCLSVLLCIIAASYWIKNEKNRYIKCLLLVILATFCYQGSINLFLTLVTLFLFINKKEQSIKCYCKEIIVAGTIWVISLITNVLGIYIINNILQTQQTRIESGSILINLTKLPNIMKYIWYTVFFKSFNLWPIYCIPITIIITSILTIWHNNKMKNLFKYIALIGIAIITGIGPIFFMKNPSAEPRMLMSIGAIVGISAIFLIIAVTKYKLLKNIIYTLIITFFLFHIIHINQIFTAHIVANKIDDNMGISIKYQIEQYEKETGNIVQKIGYHRDLAHRDFHYGYQKKYSSFTQRAFDNYYCLIEALNYYCNRKFEKVEMTQEQYITNFYGKNWNSYSDEQLAFEGDTMYLCIY